MSAGLFQIARLTKAYQDRNGVSASGCDSQNARKVEMAMTRTGSLYHATAMVSRALFRTQCRQILAQTEGLDCGQPGVSEAKNLNGCNQQTVTDFSPMPAMQRLESSIALQTQSFERQLAESTSRSSWMRLCSEPDSGIAIADIDDGILLRNIEIVDGARFCCLGTGAFHLAAPAVDPFS